jgi:hypothetical protein
MPPATPPPPSTQIIQFDEFTVEAVTQPPIASPVDISTAVTNAEASIASTTNSECVAAPLVVKSGLFPGLERVKVKTGGALFVSPDPVDAWVLILECQPSHGGRVRFLGVVDAASGEVAGVQVLVSQ